VAQSNWQRINVGITGRTKETKADTGEADLVGLLEQLCLKKNKNQTLGKDAPGPEVIFKGGGSAHLASAKLRAHHS